MHVANKVDGTCITFWIRWIVKVVETNQWRQVFRYGWSTSITRWACGTDSTCVENHVHIGNVREIEASAIWYGS
jgi:hypothetical protein